MSAATHVRWYSRALSRTVIVGLTAAAGLALFAIPALAHITITPGSVQAGSAAVLTFHVPNEEAKADTVKVDVQIPTDHPIAQLLVKPVQGWTISVKTITLAKPLVTDDGSFSQAVSEVIWSGGQIAPGQFQDFSVSADPLPQGIAQMTFKAIQTYSNGDVVRWIDVQQPGQPAPDHPAPVLTLTTGASGTGGRAGTASTVTASGSDGTARGIAIGGVLIGLLGLALAGLTWRRAKASAVTQPSMPDLDGHGFAASSAVQSGQEHRNGGSKSGSARPGTEPRPGRKGATGRRRPSHR